MKLFKSLLFFIIFFFVNVNFASAEIKVVHEPNPIYTTTKQIKFVFTSDRQDFNTNQEYIFNVGFKPQRENNKLIKPQNENLLEVVIDNVGIRPGEWTYDLCVKTWFFGSCSNETKIASGNFTVFKTDDPPALAMDHSNFRANTVQPVYILNAKPDLEYRLWFDGEAKNLESRKFGLNEITPSPYHPETATVRINVGDASPRTKTICMTYSSFFIGASPLTLSCDYRLPNISVTNLSPSSPGGFIKSNETTAPTPVPPTISVKIPIPPPPCDTNAKTCPTAFGDISIDPAKFIKSMFTILLSLAGGIALLLIILSGYRLMASQGNPEKVQAAREQLTSAIVGLLFIIFSLAILTIIGVDILRIPGFGI